jgi:hypothetical protein
VTALIALAVLTAWVGASLIALAGGARTEALGTLVAAAGAAGTLALHGADGAAAVIAAGGAAAAALLAFRVRGGWGLLPAGSAPVLTLCVVSGAVAAWFASGMVPGPLGTAEGAVSMVLIGIGAVRLFTARSSDVARAAATLIALGVGVAGGGLGAPLVAPAAGAAVLAALTGRLPLTSA